MLNRLLSILFLLIIFGGLFGVYYYYFVLNKGNLTLNANVDNYTVKLYNDDIKLIFSSECKKSKCELIDLAPFDYEMTILKEGYKEFKKELKINKKQTLQINFLLEKELKIKQLEKKSFKTSTGSKLEKNKEIVSLQKSYKFFNLEELGYFYFKDNLDNTITLFNKINNIEKNLYIFNKIEKKDIDLQQIYQTHEEIFISFLDEKYIYNIKKNEIQKIFFPQNVNYIKKNGNIYSLINNKGAFLYNAKTQKIDYFYIFKDFIFYDNNNYLGIIYDDEIEKKKNYNFGSLKGNLIIKYNFFSKKIKVLHQTDINVNKIIIESKEVYFYDENNNKFLISNIE